MLSALYFSNRTTSQEIMDKLTIHAQTYQYPEIFIAHTQYGFAINKDWEHDSVRGLQFAYVKYLPASGGDGIQIPGFQTVALLAIAIVTITGIGYSFNRKRKLVEM